MPINFTLLAEGGSDRSLIPIARWLFEQLLPEHTPVRGEFADLSRLPSPPGPLSERIRCAVDLYPCDVLLVHRDADCRDPCPRFAEIGEAYGEADVEGTLVCVVPIRETEAWLLFDETAIRRAAGNPNGTVPLSLPFGSAEGIANPKQVLLDSLQTASELSGRRLKRFRAGEARWKLANLIDDFEPLRGLAAFQRFEADVVQFIDEVGAARDEE